MVLPLAKWYVSRVLFQRSADQRPVTCITLAKSLIAPLRRCGTDSDTTLISVLAFAAMSISMERMAIVFPALVPPWMTFLRAVICRMRFIAVVYLNSNLLNLLNIDHRIHQLLLQMLNPLGECQVIALHCRAVLAFALLGSCPKLVNN
jgi:hypothetical protein